MKYVCIHLILLCFVIGMTGCSGTSVAVAEEMKGLIPEVKTLVEDNLDLFNVVQEILLDKASSYMEAEGLVTISAGSSFSSTDIFTDEEKELIRAIFSLSNERVRVSDFNAWQYTLAWDNLVDLRLQRITDENEVSLWEERAYYFEAVAEDWYAYIIISNPI